MKINYGYILLILNVLAIIFMLACVSLVGNIAYGLALLFVGTAIITIIGIKNER